MTDFNCSDLSSAEVRAQLNQSVADIMTGRLLPEAIADQSESELARRLAKSKAYVSGLDTPMKVGVVFAMWRERARLQPRSDDNPTGENALIVKLEALQWLFEGTNIAWHLYAVDDGCPENSASVAQDVAAGSELRGQVTVLRLADALPATSMPLARLASVDDSVKGGAISLGCQAALADGCDYVTYTDCDNSVHLGQLGLLLEPLLGGQHDAALGSRHTPDAFVKRHPGRLFNRIKLLRHMMKLLGGDVVPITDVPSPFKMFSASRLARIIERQSVFDFAFDYDLVLSVYAAAPTPAIVGYAFLDSFEQSAWHTLGGDTVWFRQLHGYLRALKAHDTTLEPNVQAAIENEITEPGHISALLDAGVPEKLAAAPDSLIGDVGMLSGPEVLDWVRHVLHSGSAGSRRGLADIG